MTKVNSWNERDLSSTTLSVESTAGWLGRPRGMVLDLPRLRIKPGEWTPIPDTHVDKAAVQMESFASMLEREGDIEDYFPRQIPGF